MLPVLNILFACVALLFSGFLLFYGASQAAMPETRLSRNTAYVLSGFLFGFAALSLTTVYTLL